jgi:uncharacterized repeat protein (TIGR03987 family)
MTGEMIFAAVLISLALVFYSIGVWSEKMSGRLKVWHVIFFWLGLVFDATGTLVMVRMAGGLTFDMHGVSGVLAILLMLINAVWATAVLVIKDEKAIANFHRFSLVVWVIWLIPYLSGFIIPMGGGQEMLKK